MNLQIKQMYKLYLMLNICIPSFDKIIFISATVFSVYLLYNNKKHLNICCSRPNAMTEWA